MDTPVETIDIQEESPLDELTTVTKPRSSLRALLKVVVVIGIASAVLFFVQRQTDSEVRTYSFAPDFEITTFDGETVRLADYRGRGVVVNFWASWCGPCRAEAPILADAWRNEEGGDVVFIGLTHSDTLNGSLNFIEEYGLDYPNGPDEGNKISRLYAVDGIPATFFIDKEGMLVYTHRGMLFSAEDFIAHVNDIRP